MDMEDDTVELLAELCRELDGNYGTVVQNNKTSFIEYFSEVSPCCCSGVRPYISLLGTRMRSAEAVGGPGHVMKNLVQLSEQRPCDVVKFADHHVPITDMSDCKACFPLRDAFVLSLQVRDQENTFFTALQGGAMGIIERFSSEIDDPQFPDDTKILLQDKDALMASMQASHDYRWVAHTASPCFVNSLLRCSYLVTMFCKRTFEWLRIAMLFISRLVSMAMCLGLQH